MCGNCVLLPVRYRLSIVCSTDTVVHSPHFYWHWGSLIPPVVTEYVVVVRVGRSR